MRTSLMLVVSLLFAQSVAGCAGMIVGSAGWFDRQKPDVQPMAAGDLQCADKPIEYAPVALGDYREVEARGCEKKARYHLVKIGPVGHWSKSSDVTPM
jgi:hypothetical protein